MHTSKFTKYQICRNVYSIIIRYALDRAKRNYRNFCEARH